MVGCGNQLATRANANACDQRAGGNFAIEMRLSYESQSFGGLRSLGEKEGWTMRGIALVSVAFGPVLCALVPAFRE